MLLFTMFLLHNIVIKQGNLPRGIRKIHLNLMVGKSAKSIFKVKNPPEFFLFLSLFIQPPRQEHLKTLAKLDKSFPFTIAHNCYFNLRKRY